jgi:hypothetical protein
VTRKVPSVGAALTVGLVLVGIALVIVLSGSPLTVAGSNLIPANPEIASVKGGSSGCQPGGTVPAGTSAIRISASANTGPSVTLKVFSGPLLISQGSRAAGWGVSETVTVPVTRVPRTILGATLCTAFGPSIENIQLNGAVVKGAPGSHGAGHVALRIEYLRAGPSSWWSLASGVAHRMGLGRAPGGGWVVFLLIALMLAVAALASRLALRELR